VVPTCYRRQALEVEPAIEKKPEVEGELSFGYIGGSKFGAAGSKDPTAFVCGDLT
jgi:hypothetical protein